MTRTFAESHALHLNKETFISTNLLLKLTERSKICVLAYQLFDVPYTLL